MTSKRKTGKNANPPLKVVSRASQSRKRGIRWWGTVSVRTLIVLTVGGLTAASWYVLKNQTDFTAPESRKEYVAPTKASVSPSAPAPTVLLKSARIELFFSDPHSDLLVKEPRTVVWQAGDATRQIRAVLEALWEGPHQDLLSPIPLQVVIRKVSVQDGLATINFSKELVRNHPGGTLAEMHTIYAIVNSILTNVPSVTSVQILVEGRPPETLKGHIDCRKPFTANLEIVKTS